MQQDHPKDAEFLNVHLVNYPQMLAIFASGVATGRYAMGSNEPLGEPVAAEIYDVDGEATPEPQAVAPDLKSKAEGQQALGKRKRISKEEGAYMTRLTQAVWGFADAVKESTHSEGALGIVKAVMSYTNFSRAQLMFCLDHLMEHKRSALGFLDMDADEKDLWLVTHLSKHNFLS